MRFQVLFLLVISHISYFINCSDIEPLLQPNPITFPDSDVKRALIKKLVDVFRVHSKSGHDPMEYLIKSEFLFIINLGMRLQVLLDCFSFIIDKTKIDALTKTKADKIETELSKLLAETVRNVDGMINEVNKIFKKYDNEDFELPTREPSTFRSLELIKKSNEFLKDLYFLIKEKIENSEIEDEEKRKFISTLKYRTMLYLFSGKILLLKMFYDVGNSRKLKMKFIMPGIYYLLVFETGITKRLMIKRLEDDMEFFNEFMKNYIDSTEELIDKTLFHIKEDELPMEINETLHNDLVRMRKDYNEIVDSFISIEGPINKGIKD